MNFISVICSVYNSSRWLDVYLNCVNDQFEKEFEIIFVDANSTDSSVSIIITILIYNINFLLFLLLSEHI